MNIVKMILCFIMIGILGLISGCYDVNPSGPYQPNIRHNQQNSRTRNNRPYGTGGEIIANLFGKTTNPSISTTGWSDKTMVFNYWEDTNQDGNLDFGDTFHGLGKTYFYSNEKFGLVKPFLNKQGRNGGSKFYAPNGTLFLDNTSVLSDNASQLNYQGEVKNLIQLYGVGEYNFKWYLDGVCIETNTILI